MKKIGTLSLIILLFTFSLLPTAHANHAKDKFDEGTGLFLRGDYWAAVSAFTQCIGLAPDSAPGCCCYARRGAAKNNLGQYDEAIKDANEAIKRHPADYSYGYYVRGYAYMAKKEYDKAIEDLQRGLPGAQKSNQTLLPSIYHELGRSYYGKSDYHQAILNFQKATEIDVKFASAYWWLGNAFEKNDNKEKALETYANFIRYAKPKDSRVAIARNRVKSLSKR